MKLRTLIFGGLLFFASVALAQVDSAQFNIRVFGGEDLDPPTTPVLQSVTPVASTQIDVVWSAAIDNFSVGGYVLYRDDVPLATTTQTNYSDTGLTASTTYQYYVQAFDLAGNYSATSSALATTTLAIPPPPPVTPTATSSTSGGTASRVVLDELVITPGFSTTTFAIKTSRPARFEVRFGRTTSYELGYITTERYLSDYRTTLTDLEPGTVYEYEVVGYSAYGIASILKRGQFKTLGNEVLYAPLNVTRFTALAEQDAVRLTWQLPPVDSFSYVRIVRSHLGYPTHMQDGALVYQGDATEYLDRDILNQYSPVYYTAFVVDAQGRVSSGAIVRVFAVDGNGEGLPPIIPEPEISEAERLLPEFKMPEQSDIFVTQGETASTFDIEMVRLRNDALFLISIPKSAVAQNLKTIVATLTDPTDNRKSYSFLLRLNSDHTAYEATVAPLLVEGTSGLTITIYDYEARMVGTRSQVVEFYAVKVVGEAVVWPDSFVAHWRLLLSFLLLILLLLVLYRYYRKTVT